MNPIASPTGASTFFYRAERFVTRLGWILGPIAARIALALPFLRSGRTRWDGFLTISPGTAYLFEDQFKLHIFGHLYAFPAPDRVAFIVGCAEIILPVLLLVGLATRFSAFGLLIMTAVIQLVFPEAWVNFHLYWASLALAVMALGPGPVSLDHGIDILLQRHRVTVAR
jgi:putative oxidoreductase